MLKKHAGQEKKKSRATYLKVAGLANLLIDQAIDSRCIPAERL
jgi:hypothetical protein